MRAGVFGFWKEDGTVASQQLPGLDRAGRRTATIGTRVGLLGCLSLPGGGLFTNLTGELASGLVSELLDSGEVEIRRGAIGAE